MTFHGIICKSNYNLCKIDKFIHIVLTVNIIIVVIVNIIIVVTVNIIIIVIVNITFIYFVADVNICL